MGLKSALIMLWAVGSYLALLVWADRVWEVVPLAVSLGLALAGVAFSIGHDANHGAYPGGRRAGRILGVSLDLMGASSYVWRAKHNHAHHSFTNVVGADTDIDQLPLARFAPDQSRRGFHRFQHVYMWLLYGLYALKHHLVGDIQEVVTGSLGPTRMARPRGLDLAVYCGGKVAFWGWALAVPLLLHPWWAVLAVFLMSSWVLGFTLAVTFQLAHCVEEADFASVEGLRAEPRREWAVHQVESTVDFATANPLLGWYLGGLNFQIEHHLLPRVCHVHYRRLAPVVQAVCAEHGVRHTAQPTLLGALGSHGRWLRRMGRVPEVAALAA
jgi:linoleoyl-CoA desaturase